MIYQSYNTLVIWALVTTSLYPWPYWSPGCRRWCRSCPYRRVKQMKEYLLHLVSLLSLLTRVDDAN